MGNAGCSSLAFVLSALASAGISAWLLLNMLPVNLFWLVVLMDLVSAFAGLLMPWRCPRQRARLLMPLARMSSGAGLAIFVCGAIVTSERAMIKDVREDAMLTGFQVTMIAVAGMATSTSSLYFVLITTLPTEMRELHHIARRKRLLSRWSSKAQEVLCDDMEAAVPGECAICLEELADVAVDQQGVLRLPCQHTFHWQCVGRWFGREPSCPICRYRISNFAGCVHIRSRAAAEANAKSRAQGQLVQQGETKRNVTRVPAETQTDSSLAAVIGVGSGRRTPLADPGLEVVPGERDAVVEELDPSDVHTEVLAQVITVSNTAAPFREAASTASPMASRPTFDVCGQSACVAQPASCDIFPWWRGVPCAGRPETRERLSL